MNEREFRRLAGLEPRPKDTVRVRAVPCEVYSRVVGYYRPVRQWNDGKRQEFAERVTLDLTKLGNFSAPSCNLQRRIK